MAAVIDFDPKSCELVDITEEFLASCKELGDSGLAKNADFKLSEAMSSIEIMDPKMDTGMVRIERKLDTFSAQDLANASLDDTIAIFDATFAMLTSWINAQPMDQTLYTNICVIKPNLLDQCTPHFSSMIIAILYTIDLLKAYINVAAVSNDEDICLVLGKDTPKNSYTLASVEKGLKNSLVELSAGLKDKRRAADHPKLEALKVRFEMFLALFELLHHLLPSAESLLSQQTNSDAERFVPDFKKSSAALSRCGQLLRKALATLQLGTQPPGGSSDGDFSWLPVFDPNAYLYLSPPGFPRKPRLHSRADAFVYFEQLLDTIAQMIRGTVESVGSTDEIIALLRRFGSENSSILSRSILQLIVIPNDNLICGTIPLPDIILASINRASGLLEGDGIEEKLRILFPADPEQIDVFNDFLANFLVRGFIGIFQSLGNNLARQRERMLKNNFDDFGLLMLEANRLETQLEVARMRIVDSDQVPALLVPSVQHIFPNFLLHTTLQLMHLHFSLGFQLRLFLPYEFTYIYWYFGDIVTRSMSNFADRICNSMIVEFSKSPIHQQKKVSGKKLQQKTRQDIEFRRNLGRVKVRGLLYKVETMMSHAMYKFVAGLIASKQLAVPPREQQRYAKRVEPYMNVPNMLFYNYEEFRKESKIEEDLKRPHEETFQQAANFFGQVLSLLKEADLDGQDENGATILAIQRVARKNMIVAKLMATQKMEKRISFEFSTCPQERRLNFPIIGFI